MNKDPDLKHSPFSKRQILHSSIRKGFADDNFEFDEKGRKSTKRVENTVGKGEIARYQRFLLFPQCFEKTYTADKGLFGKGLTDNLLHVHQKVMFVFEKFQDFLGIGENVAFVFFLISQRCLKIYSAEESLNHRWFWTKMSDSQSC